MICPYCAFDNIEGVDRCENCGHDLGGLDLPDGPGAERGLEFIYQRLADLPAKRPSEVEVTDPVYLAVRMMQNEDTGCVLVMNGRHLAGIITPWDILHKVAGASDDLNATLAAFPELLLGSYPKIGDPECAVKLTLESKDAAYVERALAHLLGLLPEEAVVRTE